MESEKIKERSIRLEMGSRKQAEPVLLPSVVGYSWYNFWVYAAAGAYRPAEN